VRRLFSTAGRDIYGHGEITRRLYEIQAEIRHGNSGGPFILANGQVAGVVFASSVVANGVGYAIASNEVSTFLRGATGAHIPVSTGTCAG
jgi:S1-C subfamily serine protease